MWYCFTWSRFVRHQVLICQQSNPSLIASVPIILQPFVMTHAAALLNGLSWIKGLSSSSTHWFLEEEQGQRSDQRHVSQQRLHHHSQHAVDLWKHESNSWHTHTQINTEGERQRAHASPAPPHSPAVEPPLAPRSTWQVGNSIAAWFHTCPVSPSTFSMTY